MKKITLCSVLAIGLISCGKEKDMLTKYQSENVKALNFELKDLDFKINKIEKISEIKGSDSMVILRKQLAESWIDNPPKEMIDTISYPFVLDAINKSLKSSEETFESYKELSLSAARRGDYIDEYTYSSKRDESLRNMENWQNNLKDISKKDSLYKYYEKNKETVISTKYKASYSINNPMLGNAKQTFEKFFYSNKENTEFVKEEAIEKQTK